MHLFSKYRLQAQNFKIPTSAKLAVQYRPSGNLSMVDFTVFNNLLKFYILMKQLIYVKCHGCKTILAKSV